MNITVFIYCKRYPCPPLSKKYFVMSVPPAKLILAGDRDLIIFFILYIKIFPINDIFNSPFGLKLE